MGEFVRLGKSVASTSASEIPNHWQMVALS